MEDELIRGFAELGFKLDERAAQQCLSLCSSFMLKPSELLENWDAFAMNAHLPQQSVQESHINNFRVYLQGQQRDAFRRQHGNMHFYTSDDVDMIMDEMDVDREPLQTPVKQPKVQNASRATPLSRHGAAADERQVFSPTTPFSQRTTKCSVQYTFNEHLTETPRPAARMEGEEMDGLVLHKLKDIKRCDLKILSSGPAAGCRYMADQLESRFNEIERRMKIFSKAFSDSRAVSVAQHLAYAVQDKVTVVGRVCCDSEGHLNDKSVLLEGSVEYSGGQRVRLDLHEIPRFSLFPGQIVVVEGHNPSGHCLVASQIFDALPLPPCNSELGDDPATKRQAIDLASVSSLQKETTHILAATGPFTTTDNLSFEPLVELLSYCRKRRPNLLVLMGPFIDAEHPQLKRGTVGKLFSHIFQEEIRTRIEEYCDDLGEGARVVLVPSTRDAFHDRVFPQPPFDANTFEDPARQITLLSNPGVFCLDEVAIGCCTVDVVKQLSSEESSRTPAGASTDRMLRLSSHIIGQRSFYPLFPPAVGTRLDLSLDPSALDLPCTPDILLLPSDLVPFIKCYDYSSGALQEGSSSEKCSSLIVNTGRLAKGTMGGTFVEISVLAEPSETPNDIYGVPARTKASFVRI